MAELATLPAPAAESRDNQALRAVQYFAKKFRLQNSAAPAAIDYSVPVGYEERIGHLGGTPGKRLIIFLRSTGCEWVEKTGGCTMCGFYGATTQGLRIGTKEYLAQLEHVAGEVDLGDYPIVSIYNDGNIFNECEISMEAVEGMCEILNRYSGVKKVVFESRIDYSPVERVEKIKKCLSGKQLEVAFGFESANPQVMNLCINKGLSAHNFDHFYKTMRRTGVLLKPLLLLKPPFLTETEAIADILATLGYLARKGIRDVDLEVMTVEKATVVYNLWNRGLYEPPMLWSIVELIRQYREQHGDAVNLYISPWNYSVESIDWAKNCGACDDAVEEAIFAYNHHFDPSALDGLDCACRHGEWAARMGETDAAALPDRILDRLGRIATGADRDALSL